MRANLLFGPLLCCIPLISVGNGFAQRADDEDDSIQFARLGTARGMRQYVSETWGVVGVDLINPANEQGEVLATFRTRRIPDIEFARRIQVPARSIRRTWVPIKVPKASRRAPRVRYFGKLIDTRSGSEVVLRNIHEGVEHEVDLRLTHDVPVTGIFLEDRSKLNSHAADLAYETLIALRTARGCNRRLVMFAGRHVPATPLVFDGLDAIVLYDNRFGDDATVVSTLRAWLHDGGQLWIMLDQVDFGCVERLLGNTFSCGLVDRVQLDTVDIQPVNPRPSVNYPSSEQYERPVDFARVVVTDMEVTHTVGPWPAAFSCDMGRGRVVFTTVGGRAWIRRPRVRHVAWDPETMTNYEPTPELEELPLEQPPSLRSYSPDSLEPYLAEQIGYRVVSRTPVLAILGLFCVCLLTAGTYLARTGRLERMAWLVPSAAVLASVPLVWVGARARHTVAPTVGQAQFVEVGESDNAATVSGLLAVYDSEPNDGPLGAQRGGCFELDGAGLQGTVRRMVWTDLGQWQWENLHLPAGVRTATFHRPTVLEQAVQATGTFSEAGFVGHVTGPFPTLTDAVIATPGVPCLAVQSDGTALRAGPGDVLPRGQYLSEALLSDEQTRRQEVYDSVLGSAEGRLSPITRPTLLGWSEPVDMGFRFPRGVEHVGAALWSIPLKIARPERGTIVVIPPPMIASRIAKGPGADGVSPLFDARSGQWIPSTIASRTWLQFQIPQPVLPIELHRVRLTMQITAPSRRLQVLRLVEGGEEILFSETNPIGRFEWTIDPESLPEMDESGAMIFGISVSNASGNDHGNVSAAWKIDFVSLEARGRIL